MNKPILSIAVPAYNAQAYLDKCLSSMAETCFEGLLDVIIINDGSSDDTSKIAETYTTKYPGIFRLIEKENGGHGSGIMTGISNATGLFFRIVDADDWVDTDCLKSFLEDLKSCDSDLTLTPYTLVDMTSGKKRAKPIPKNVKLYTQLRIEDVTELYHYYDIHCLTAKTSMLRKLEIELPLKVFYEDSEYVFKVAAGAETVTCLPENVYQYMVGNVSQSMDARKMVERYDQHDLILHRLAEEYHHIKEIKKNLCEERIRTLALKQLIIGLIYDADRKRGRTRAENTMRWLDEACPRVYGSMGKKYRILIAMNILGVRAGFWEKMKSVYQKAFAL